jgi:hypothetical protein
MYPTQNFTQLTIFGTGYVAEQHADETNRYLPLAEHRVVNFDELLKALRAALSLR